MDAKSDEISLLNLLRQRDEMAFTQLVEQYHTSLVRLARLFIRDELVAEELAQESWLAVLQGLNHFEGRSSLKTWIFTILTNKAKTRSRRENRSFVFSDLQDRDFESPTVASERFKDQSAGRSANHWAVEPASWAGIPEKILLSEETLRLIRQAIDGLPENQRAVIILRDMEEISAQEICNILEISETNQRVLLHRARARVREALEAYLQSEH
ncbi:MAG TPA: sigma-70 family RNA polymerase sigma factor [Anaerolineales bacterium]